MEANLSSLLNASTTADSPVPSPWIRLNRQDWSWEKCIAYDVQEMQALIVCNTSKEVLLKWEEGRWILPGRLYPAAKFRSVYEPLFAISCVHEIIGCSLSLRLLRQAWIRCKQENVNDTSFPYEKSVTLMQCEDQDVSEHNLSLLNLGYQWVPVQEASVFHVIEEAAAIIRSELEHVLNGTQPDNRLAWQRPGWLHACTSWMIQQLRVNRDAILAEEIVQLRSSHLSVVLQAETTGGRFFLKCTPPLWNDAAYTKALGRIAPSYVAEPVAVDAERQMMITIDYGEILNPFDMSNEETDRLMRNYAHLQMETIGRVEELISVGLPDFRVPKLPEHIDELALCPLFVNLGNSERSRKNVTFFCENMDLFKVEVKKLELVQLPAVVNHNDLSTSNVYKPWASENYMFFDFGEGYVSHPFALSLSETKRKVYIDEWRAKSGATCTAIDKAVLRGSLCYSLACVIMRLQDARVSEFPEVEEHLDQARWQLSSCVARFREILAAYERSKNE